MEDAKTIGGVNPIELLRELDTPLSDAEIEAQGETVEGAIFLAYLSAKKIQPAITEKQIADCLTLADIPIVMDALFPKSASGEKPEGEKKMT